MIPYWYEIVVWVWYLGLLLSQITNPGAKGGLSWAKYVLVVLGVFSYIAHGVGIFVDPSWWSFVIYVRNLFYGVSLLVATILILDFLSFHHLFGPWAIIIGILFSKTPFLFLKHMQLLPYYKFSPWNFPKHGFLGLPTWPFTTDTRFSYNLSNLALVCFGRLHSCWNFWKRFGDCLQWWLVSIFVTLHSAKYWMKAPKLVKTRILEKRVVDQIQKSADQILNMQLG